MSVYAFIFARGGSKGLPGKNIKLLGDLPLLAHSINVAKTLHEIDKVYVSTDSDEIAAIALQYKAEVIARPAELATDFASEWDAWKHAITYLKHKNENFDVFLSLPTTSPLRSKEDIHSCIGALTSEVDMVLTVTPSSRSPYFNMIHREEDGVSQLIIKDSTFFWRQDAPVSYDITTVAYVSRPNFILNHSGIFAGKVKSIVIPKHRAIDIDDEIDFLIAETIYANRRKYVTA